MDIFSFRHISPCGGHTVVLFCHLLHFIVVYRLLIIYCLFLINLSNKLFYTYNLLYYTPPRTSLDFRLVYRDTFRSEHQFFPFIHTFRKSIMIILHNPLFNFFHSLYFSKVNSNDTSNIQPYLICHLAKNFYGSNIIMF